MSIFGYSLANTPDPGVSGLANKIANGVMPTVLVGVSVTINGKKAFVAFISREQINVLAPDNTAQGPVSVVVKNHSEVSAPFTAQLQPAVPGLFQLGTTHYGYAGNWQPGRRSENRGRQVWRHPDSLVYRLGTHPAAGDCGKNRHRQRANETASPVTVTVGNTAVNVLWAGTFSNSIGLYQINIQLPQSIGSGRLPVVARVAGFQSPTGVTELMVQPN